jgi:hypothetical protein
MPKAPRYTVEVGDAHFYFAHGRKITEKKLEAVFQERIEGLQTEMFPGLRVRDIEGQLLKPRLQVVLVPEEEGQS